MKYPILEAHRGHSAAAPENTLAAFRSALALQAEAIELDVHLSKDGHLVVMHDDTLDRTTNGRGALAGLNLAELRQLDAGAWFGPSFAGEKIPLLAEVLELLTPTRTRLNIEIKYSPRIQQAARQVVDLLRQYGRQDFYVVSSFDLPALLVVQALAPEITLALIGEGAQILPLARQHGLPWIHAYHRTLTDETIAEAHAAGLQVNTWTLDDPQQLAAWAQRGVDKICTNRLGELQQARRTLQQAPRP